MEALQIVDTIKQDTYPESAADQHINYDKEPFDLIDEESVEFLKGNCELPF